MKLSNFGFFRSQVINTILNETTWETLEDVDYDYLKNNMTNFDEDFTKKFLNQIVRNFSKNGSRPLKDCLLKAQDAYTGIMEQKYVPKTKSMSTEHAKEILNYYKTNIRDKTILIV